jgi:hypothetical protein
MRHPVKTVLAIALVAGAAMARAQSAPVLGGGPVRDAQVAGSLALSLQRLGAAERGPVWIAWEVPAVPALSDSCCLDDQFRGTSCRLEKRNQSRGSSGKHVAGGGRLVVLARVAAGKVGRVRGVSSACSLDAGGLPFVRLAGVAPAESVALLAALAQHSEGAERDPDDALGVLAHHADPAAGAALVRLAGVDQPEKRREKALFWIGQARGEEGARFLAGVARTDRDPDIREKAVFSLSQSEAPGATAAIVEVARRDSDPEVRGQALFWLAQSGDATAPQVILSRLDEDPSQQVREKAVFAISQLEGDQAVPLLVRIARERRDPEIRKQALFWLGQSEDPRALDFFEEMLKDP